MADRESLARRTEHDLDVGLFRAGGSRAPARRRSAFRAPPRGRSAGRERCRRAPRSRESTSASSRAVPLGTSGFAAAPCSITSKLGTWRAAMRARCCRSAAVSEKFPVAMPTPAERAWASISAKSSSNRPVVPITTGIRARARARRDAARRRGACSRRDVGCRRAALDVSLDHTPACRHQAPRRCRGRSRAVRPQTAEPDRPPQGWAPRARGPPAKGAERQTLSGRAAMPRDMTAVGQLAEYVTCSHLGSDPE